MIQSSTPAMAAGCTDHRWTLEELLAIDRCTVVPSLKRRRK